MKQILMLLLCSLELYPVSLKLLDGTIVVLSESQLGDALFRGVPFAEGGVENLYDVSFKSIKAGLKATIDSAPLPADELQTTALANLKQYAETITESATSKLIGQMFHRAGGQFQLTEAPNNPVRQLSPENIGNLLRIISEPEAKGQMNLESRIKVYLNGLKLEDASGKVFKPKDLNPFVNALLGSLQECKVSNSNATYAPGTTQGILIGYALRRCNTKADLAKYLSGLTGRAVQLSDQEYTNADIRRIISEGPQIDDPAKFGDWLTCAFYEKNYQAGLPKISSNTTVTFDGVSFPDCVETTALNLVGIVSFARGNLGTAPQGITFSPALQKFYTLKDAPTTKPSEVQNNAVHQVWTDVVENMPGIAYNRIKISGQQGYASLPAEYEGFMPVDDQMISSQELSTLPKKTITIGNQTFTVHEKTVGTAKYLVVPQGSNMTCFEMMPTASNMTVVLNNLFNLGLYEPKALFETTFANQNFSKVCNKLGWQLQTSNIDNIQGTVIKIEKGQSSFAINLHRKAHGYVSVIKDTSNNYVSNDILTSEAYQQHPQEISEMIALSDATLTMQKLYKVAGNDGTKFAQLLRNVDVRNADRCLTVVQQTLELNIRNAEVDAHVAKLIISSLSHDPHYINLIVKMRVIKKCSAIIKNSLKAALDIRLIKEGLSANFFEGVRFLAQAEIYTKSELLVFIEKGMASSNPDIQSSALNLIESLVKDKILTIEDKPKLLELVEKGLVAKDRDIQLRALFLAGALVKDKILTIEDKPKLLELVEKGLVGNGGYVQLKALDLIESLVKNKILTIEDKPKLLELVEKGLVAKDPDVQSKALVLIESLIKDKILTIEDKPKLLELVEKFMASINPYFKSKALNLIEPLVKNKILTIEDKSKLLEWVKKGMAGSDALDQSGALKAIAALVNHKILTVQDKPQLLEWLKKQIVISDMYDQLKILNIIELLIAKNIFSKNEILETVKNLEITNKINSEDAKNLEKNIASIQLSSAEDIRPAVSGSSGTFRTTQPNLMRYAPRDILPSDQDLQDLARSVGISPEEIGGTENSAESLARSRERSTFVPDIRQSRTNRFGYEIEPDELPEGTAGSGARAIPKIGGINTAQTLSAQPDFMNRVQQPSSARNYSFMPSIAAMNAQRSLAAQRQLASEQMSLRRLAEAAKRKAPDVVRAGFRSTLK